MEKTEEKKPLTMEDIINMPRKARRFYAKKLGLKNIRGIQDYIKKTNE